MLSGMHEAANTVIHNHWHSNLFSFGTPVQLLHKCQSKLQSSARPSAGHQVSIHNHSLFGSTAAQNNVM